MYGMWITKQLHDRRQRRGKVEIGGETFACYLETDWNGMHRGAYPRFPAFCGVEMPHLKFGFAEPWKWILDLNACETAAGVAVSSQGYQKIEGACIPFLRTRRFFWQAPEMLYEVAESRHLDANEYIIYGIAPEALQVDPSLQQMTYHRDGVAVTWQFSPTPISARPERGGWVFKFAAPVVETLITWARDGEKPPTFSSISAEVAQINVHGPRGARTYDTRELHQCIEPDEALALPDGEVIFTGDDPAKLPSGLWELAVRRIDGDTVHLGAARVFSLDRLAQSDDFPMLRPSLVRAMRSLKERMVFGVVPEDDPTQEYLWGTGTWPRCFAILCLDNFGLPDDAYAYAEFMLDASQQFLPMDGLPHLWDNFYITGPRINERLYDINGHSMKLFEVGKFYLNHRGDPYAARLLETHYDTLRGWCAWIARHMEADGAVLDETESNVWAMGYGAFTQAPAIAGVQLFLQMARDTGCDADVAEFQAVVEQLLHGLQTRLYGDAANPYLEIPAGTGECYLTYLPQCENQRNWWDQPVQRIGIACYSLAVNYFLQDPQVALLAPDDPCALTTLELALAHLGDNFDSRIITWHIRRFQGHMGYGQGQLLMALLYAGRAETFRERLQALFDVSTREVGDVYLMQETLARSGNTNRGNKAHLTYYPVLIAALAGLAPAGEPLRAMIPDLVVRRRKG